MRVCHQCGSACKDEDRFCAACGAAISERGSGVEDPLIGRTIGGSYTLQELVGVGGMGRVYRAEQGVLGRTVAVKVIHPHLLGDEQTVARFYTEARAASRLNHPNSVSIIDFGRTDDGILYLAMEFLKGKDLALIMHEEGPLPLPRICEILDGSLAALAEAHALGVVHRDLKPENIILRPIRSGGDLIKVVDFGLATIVGAGGTAITKPGLVCGTPDYMAPEQGRGEQVDGRGDLYSLGVMLFELLTEQLPYTDETPTKVVLRHIHDPIPDPRQVAPYRNISPALADLAMKALSKRADDRFQTAEEMQKALRDAAEALVTKRPDPSQRACPSCGSKNAVTMRFCGSCGFKLTGTFALPASVRPASRPSFFPKRGQRVLVGRSAELERIDSLRAEAHTRTVTVRVAGEPGVGKTRFLNEVANRLSEKGDVVVLGGPHPTGSLIPFGSVRTLLADLLGVDSKDLARLAADAAVFGDPLARAGVAEVVKPTGLPGLPGEPRTAAVAAALATAVKVASARGTSGRVGILVDDLPRCDGLSRQVISDLPIMTRGDSVLLVTVALSGADHRGEAVIELQGLDIEQAARFLGNKETPIPRPREGAAGAARRLLPLYLEQLEALGGNIASPDDTLPPRLADAVLLRIERLDLSARRMLQAAAVLGDRCELAVLREVSDREDMSALDTLVKEQLIVVHGDEIEIVHPFIRDLVEASIPAEARKVLHRRALDVVRNREEPLEVLAEHAFRAGEPMTALVLLEKMGDVALIRGDPAAAVVGFQRALQLARREALESGDTVMDGAIITFSRKLGEALENAGDVAGADGVLREAMDLTGPDSPERARMLLAVGGISMRRDRRRDAMRLFGQALEIATSEADERLEAPVQLALARLRRREGDLVGSANAYRRALELFEKIRADVVLRARTELELAEVLIDVGDTERSIQHLERTGELAKAAEAPALAALALGTLATVDEISGDHRRASQRYQDAARLAAEAGDAAGRERWRKAVTTLSGLS